MESTAACRLLGESKGRQRLLAWRKLAINLKVQVKVDRYRDMMCHEGFALVGVKS